MLTLAAHPPEALAAPTSDLHWTTTRQPGRADLSAGPDIVAISCPSTEFCAAVTDVSTPLPDGKGHGSVLYTWTPAGWTGVAAATVPLPGHSGVVSLYDVSCWTSTGCLAVGETLTDRDGEEVRSPLTERWDGRTWTAENGGSPPIGVMAATGAVDCSSADSCVITGGSLPSQISGLWLGYEVVWNGDEWNVEPMTNAPFDYRHTTISCVSGDCLAVGPSGVFRRTPVIWTQLNALPEVAGATDVTLFDVSCPGERWCVVVGQYVGDWPDAAVRPLASVWNGRTFTPIPALTGTSEATPPWLWAVSCPEVRQCVAVGNRVNAETGERTPVAVSWDGTTIATSEVPTLDGKPAIGFGFQGLSCSSVSSCVAIGTVRSDDRTLVGVIARSS